MQKDFKNISEKGRKIHYTPSNYGNCCRHSISLMLAVRTTLVKFFLPLFF